jgi:hypothetical protein
MSDKPVSEILGGLIRAGVAARAARAATGGGQPESWHGGPEGPKPTVGPSTPSSVSSAYEAPDAALGRCPALLQCHREMGHAGGHEAREENTDA